MAARAATSPVVADDVGTGRGEGFGHRQADPPAGIR